MVTKEEDKRTKEKTKQKNPYIQYDDENNDDNKTI